MGVATSSVPLQFGRASMSADCRDPWGLRGKSLSWGCLGTAMFGVLGCPFPCYFNHCRIPVISLIGVCPTQVQNGL